MGEKPARIRPPLEGADRRQGFSAEALAQVPEGAGVYQLLGVDRVALKIAGTQNLRQALEGELLGDDPPPFFVFDEDPMYTKRESELIQQFLAAHGRMPEGG